MCSDLMQDLSDGAFDLAIDRNFKTQQLVEFCLEMVING